MAEWWKELRIRLVRWGISTLGAESVIRLEPSRLLKRRLQRHEDALAAALGGVIGFHLLKTAHSIGLFRLLHATPGMRIPAIATAIGTTGYATEVLLLGLTPMSLVHKVGDRYYNNPWLSPMLSGGMYDDALGRFIDFFHQVVNPAAAHLEESVKEGRPAGLTAMFGAQATSYYQEVTRDPRLNRCYERAMWANWRCNRDAFAADRVFERCTSVLDVGGSTGDLATAIARRHASTKVTVYDFPEAVAGALERFRQEGLGDRLAAMSGDILNGPFPRGHDCILLAHVTGVFSRERVRYVLRKAHDSLPVGGKVVVYDSVVRDDESGPLSYGLLSAYLLSLAEGEGRFYSAQHAVEAMREVGFVRVTRKTLPMDEAIVIGVKE